MRKVRVLLRKNFSCTMGELITGMQAIRHDSCRLKIWTIFRNLE